MEELEYARVLIKLHVAREVRWTICMKVNETLCQIAIEEEPVNKVKRCHFGEWESNSDDGELGSFVGRECGASEELEFRSNLNFQGGVGEDMTVEEAEGLLRKEAWKPYAVTEDRSDVVEGQQISGIQNVRRLDDLVGQDGCINEAVDELEGLTRKYSVALNEVGGQWQTLKEIKKTYLLILGLLSVIGPNSKC